MIFIKVMGQKWYGENYPMKERREVFAGFFSGFSLIRCIEFLLPPPEFRRPDGTTFSDIRRPGFAGSSSLSDFLLKGWLWVDSLKARGLFTASTSSVTELVAISFWRAVTKQILDIFYIRLLKQKRFILLKYFKKIYKKNQILNQKYKGSQNIILFSLTKSFKVRDLLTVKITVKTSMRNVYIFKV